MVLDAKKSLIWVGVFATIAASFGSRSVLSGHTSPSSQLNPEASPGDKAVLDYSGSLVDVTVNRKVTPTTEKLDFSSHGEVLESETYKFDPQHFSISAAAGEAFNPPVPLLTFPLAESNSNSWKGQLVCGGISKNAQAKIEISPGSTMVDGVERQAVVSLVTLTLEGGGATPATRTLKFWFVRDLGVVRREFSGGVKRFPAPE